jgi:hypothetical protein
VIQLLWDILHLHWVWKYLWVFRDFSNQTELKTGFSLRYLSFENIQFWTIVLSDSEVLNYIDCMLIFNEKQNIPHCQNSSKIKPEHRRNGQNRYLQHIHFQGVGRALQYKMAELNYFYGPKLLVKWLGYASVLHMWVKCHSSTLYNTSNLDHYS